MKVRTIRVDPSGNIYAAAVMGRGTQGAAPTPPPAPQMRPASLPTTNASPASATTQAPRRATTTRSADGIRRRALAEDATAATQPEARARRPTARGRRHQPDPDAALSRAAATVLNKTASSLESNY